jgi:hypothetical protein
MTETTFLQNVPIGGVPPMDESLKGLLKLYGRRMRLVWLVSLLATAYIGGFFTIAFFLRYFGIEHYRSSQAALAVVAAVVIVSMMIQVFRGLREHWQWENTNVFDLSSKQSRGYAIGEVYLTYDVRLTPPIAAQLFVFALFLKRENCDSIVGDLEEGYRRAFRTSGKSRAVLWYWIQVITSAGTILWTSLVEASKALLVVVTFGTYRRV